MDAEFQARIAEIQREWDAEVQKIATSRETLNGILNNSNKQKASDFLKLTKELHQKLE